MLNLNNFIITLFQELFRKFTRDGVARYPSENLVLLVQQINDVAKLLGEVAALTRYTPLLSLTFFIKCIVPEFVGTFKLILNIERFIQL